MLKRMINLEIFKSKIFLEARIIPKLNYLLINLINGTVSKIKYFNLKISRFMVEYNILLSKRESSIEYCLSRKIA